MIGKKSSTFNTSKDHAMKSLHILFLFLCLMLINGCSSIKSGRYLCLINSGDEFYEVKRKDWITKGRDPCFGKYRPPLYGFRLESKGELRVYPIIIDQRYFEGPAFLPLIPTPKSLAVSKDSNLLRLAYSGDPEDIRIEMVDDRAIDPQVVKKRKAFGEIMVSLQLEEALVVDGKLTVKLSCQGEQKTLLFVNKRVTSFIPFFSPL